MSGSLLKVGNQSYLILSNLRLKLVLDYLITQITHIYQ